MSYTRFRYHLITGTKNREPLITAAVEAILYPALCEKAHETNGAILQVGGIADHVHMLATVRPTVALSDFMREVKTASSRAVNRSGILPTRFRWQPGYGAITVAPRQIDRIWRYVRDQKRHHRHDTAESWLERSTG